MNSKTTKTYPDIPMRSKLLNLTVSMTV